MVFAVERKIVVTSVQVVVWIGDFSAIVQVRVDVDSVTLVGKFGFALVTWEVFWKTFWSWFTQVDWAASTSNSWEHVEAVEVVGVLSGDASFFGWHDTFIIWNAYAFLFSASASFSTNNVFVVRPEVDFICSFAHEIVDLWTFTSGGWLAFSGVAASVEVVDGEFTIFAGSEFGFSPDSFGARFIAGSDPSENTFTFDVLASVFRVTFSGTDWFTVTEDDNWVAPHYAGFVGFLRTLRIASDTAVHGVTSTLTNRAVIGR